MSDPITNRIVQILEESEHVLVPLEELYDRLFSEGLMIWMTPELLEDLIFSDERFEIYEGLGGLEFFNPFIQAELTSHGLLGGPMVMLVGRDASSEDIMMDMLLHLQEMNKALETAWQLRPPDNPEVEAELLNLLMMGDMLEREIKHALKTGALMVDMKVDEERKNVSNG